MKKRLCSMLCCPICGGSITISHVFLCDNDEIIDGLLDCSECHEWFPVISGIPRMLIGELKRELILKQYSNFQHRYKKQLPNHIFNEWLHSVTDPRSQTSLKTKTAKSFGYEWNTFHTMCNQYRKNFLDFISPIQESFFHDKIVLDAGSGVGRHAYWAAKFGAREVVGIDLSGSVEASYRNTKELPNVHIIQADIYHLPFHQPFDYIFSIGVLHHLPEPEGGFQALVKHLKTGSTLSIWVYGRSHNIFHVYVNEAIRNLTRHIPFKILHTLCYLPALCVEASNRCYRLLYRYQCTRMLASLLPFKVYADFPFIVKVNDTFDIFATPKSSYWTIDEIRSWYQRVGMNNVVVSLLRIKSVKAYGVLSKQ